MRICNEKWRPIAGCYGHDVSDHGRVRSLSRLVQKRMHGKVWFVQVAGRLRKLSKQKSGHLYVGIDGRQHRVHVLVLTAFRGECPIGMEGRHKNGRPADNRLINLMWGSRSTNIRDRRRHGSKSYKLTPAQIRRIRVSADTQTALAARYGVGQAAISKIKRGASNRDVL